jgi:Mg-chelatase subunit ChlD
MRREGKAKAAFEAMVVMREACTIAGIPMAVLFFNGEVEVGLDWNVVEDAVVARALSGLLEPSGGTDLGGAVTAAEEMLSERPERDRFLFVLTDAGVDEGDRAAVPLATASIRSKGMELIPIGIGAGEDLTRIFPGACLLESAKALPAFLARSIISAVKAENRS